MVLSITIWTMTEQDSNCHHLAAIPKKCTALCLQKRAAIFAAVESTIYNGKIPHGVFQTVATKFSVARTTVRRLWLHGKNSVDTNMPDLVDRRIFSGMCPKYNKETLSLLIQDIPYNCHQTIRDTANALNISPTTFCQYLKKKTQLVQQQQRLLHSRLYHPLLNQHSPTNTKMTNFHL